MRRLALIALLALAGCTSKGTTSPKGTSSGTPAGNSSSAITRSVQLSWGASTGSPSSYSIERSTDALSYSAVSSSGTNSALVGGLSPGTTYYFRVRALNSGGYSSYSNVFAVTP